MWNQWPTWDRPLSFSLALVTAPTSEPISLTEARAHLRVDDAVDDGYITAIIAAARARVESDTSRALISQSWRYTATGFPACNGFIKLWKSPLVSVQSINYVDSSGGSHLLASNQYVVDTDNILGQIAPASNVSWPSTAYRPAAVTVAFTAGYPSADLIPPDLIAALKLVLGDLYASREANIVGTIVAQNPAVAALLDPWRLPVV